MITYLEEKKYAIYNGKVYVRDDKTGYYLNSTSRKRLHRVVYENEVGPIPDGFEIHHIDRDKSNNEISNLQCLSKREHAILHGTSLTKEEKEKRAKNIVKYAMPKAKEWHSTEQGKTWHSQHGRESYKQRAINIYTCDNCENPFETKHIYSVGNKFCSNKCKSAYRRKKGLDDIQRRCICCGENFTINKYSKKQKCEICKNKEH